MTVLDPVKTSPAPVRGLPLSSADLYLNPVGLLPARLGEGARLAGGLLAFTGCEVLRRGLGHTRSTLLDLTSLERLARKAGDGEALAARLRVLSAPRPDFAGMSMDRPRLMGVLNVTPDSFSDGGRYFDTTDAVRRGLAMLDAGADIIDVGGESTRPGADPVEPDEETRRVVPVVRTLAERGARVSIDTRHASVMGAALEAGAAIVNDVTGLGGDSCSMDLVARAGVPAVLMHMDGDPRTMQRDPCYRLASLDIFDQLALRLAACFEVGIPAERLCVDPGIGFGKTVAHNVEILQRLALFHGLGCPILLGASRKSFIARLSRDEPPQDRLPGSLAAALAAAAKGAQILRVHDVAETRQALAVQAAIF